MSNKFGDDFDSDISLIVQKVVDILYKVPGMTTADNNNFQKATHFFKLQDGTRVKIYINFFRVKHIFLENSNNQMIFGGYVGWIHTKRLNEAMDNIRKEFGDTN